MSDFRKPFKSDHLGVVDLEAMIESGQSLVVTVVKATQEQTKVAGSNGLFNICYFKENIKPLVLNSTNSKKLRELSGSKSVHIEEWIKEPFQIELIADLSVKFGKETVGGVRFKLPSPAKVKEIPTAERFAKIKEAIIAKTRTVEQINANFELTKTQQDELSGL
jgi:hypothetical protein